MSEAEPIIRFENVYKSFEDKLVHRGVTLSIEDGAIITLLGPSGTGKSVLLKELIGLMKPDEGAIYVEGRNIVPLKEKELLAIRRNVGMLFQGAALFDSLSVGENIAFPLREHLKLEESEIEERVERMLPEARGQLTVSTFHSICARLLREFGGFFGLSANFSIYDQDESMRLIAQLWDGGSARRDEVRGIYRHIEKARHQGWDSKSFELNDFDILARHARDLLDPYQAALRRADAEDFSGLILDVVRLLEAGGEESQRIRQRYRHILVDEYQDTNAIQARLVYALGRDADSITVVGDDDQSIYAWRGARSDNLLNFSHVFSDARVLRLEQNYRSTGNILAAANALISVNPERMDKQLFTSGDDGEKLQFARCPDDRFEARWVGEQISAALAEGIDAAQIAVLYRTNAQSRSFEEQLRRRRIPYRVVGGTNFYSRQEVRDLIAYLRLALKPSSDVDLLRVLNMPTRGIGETSRLRLIEAGRGQILYEVLRDAPALKKAGLRSAAQMRLRAFAELIDDMGQAIGKLEADQAVKLVAQRSGLLEHFERLAEAGGQKGDEAAARIENLSALVSAAQDFVAEASLRGEQAGLAGFLQEAALASDLEDVQYREETKDAVSLMTLHAAKGLEFDCVLLTGLEEGLFPQGRDGGLEDSQRVEEERRLCYVGLTRAKKRLLLSCAMRRRHFGEQRAAPVSRFVDELPRTLLARDQGFDSVVEGAAHLQRQARPYADVPTQVPSWRRAKAAQNAARDHLEMDLSADFIDDVQQSSSPGLAVGAKVSHASFGEGLVTAVDGQGARMRLEIRFADRSRRVLARYVSLLEGVTL